MSEQKEELRGMHVSRVQKLANAYYKSNQEIIDSWEDLKAMMQTEVVLPPQPEPDPKPELREATPKEKKK